MSSERKCLWCGKILTGRIDQRFCSDAHRTLYNNKLNADTTPIIRNINNALRKNRRILDELLQDGKKKVHRAILDQHGFIFNLHTSTFETPGKGTVYYVYDIGYSIEGDVIRIVKG